MSFLLDQTVTKNQLLNSIFHFLLLCCCQNQKKERQPCLFSFGLEQQHKCKHQNSTWLVFSHQLIQRRGQYIVSRFLFYLDWLVSKFIINQPCWFQFLVDEICSLIFSLLNARSYKSNLAKGFYPVAKMGHYCAVI